MTAVDTNVVVRLLTGDDREQAAAAKALFESDSIWIAKTVLLETVWVLQNMYGLDIGSIRTALTRLLGLNNVTAEDRPAVAAALALTTKGVEFADAIHLSGMPEGAVFASLDKSFVRRARLAGMMNIRLVKESGGD